MDRQFAGPGAEQVARNTDMIAKVKQFVERKGAFADSIEADIDLKALALLLQRGKSRLALRANGHDAPGNCYRHTMGLEFFCRGFVPFGANCSDGVRERELVWIGGLS